MRKAGGIITIIGGTAVIMFEWLWVVGELFDLIGPIGAPLIVFGTIALTGGVVALIGGIYALRSRAWGFALTGGIFIIINGAVIMGEWLWVVAKSPLSGVIGAPLILIGILGTIFISLRKREFE